MTCLYCGPACACTTPLAKALAKARAQGRVRATEPESRADATLWRHAQGRRNRKGRALAWPLGHLRHFAKA